MKTEVTLLPLTEAARLTEAFWHFPERMERARRCLRTDDRLRCLGASALLSGVLGIREEDLRYSAYGKPYVPDMKLRFNLSHSGNYVLLATDGEEIGADIERIDSVRLRLAERVSVPEEQAWMRDDPLRFFALWTMKESVMKQCGLGLTLRPDTFSVLPLLRGDSVSIEGRRLFGATVCFDGHCISVCAPHPIEPLSPRIVTAEELEQA